MILRSFTKLVLPAFSMVCALGLTGCLTHWFLETNTRLQMENGTDDCTLLGFYVISEDSTQFEPWIVETIEPGEHSRVEQGDWVGKFRVQLRYKRNGKTLYDVRKMEFEGGSSYMVVEQDSDSLTYRFI